MKIAFYIGHLARGGAERVITNLANYFCNQGYQCIMVTKLKEENEYEIDASIPRIIADITEEETSSRIRNFFRRIRKLRKVWITEKPDIIVSFIGKNNFMAIVSNMFLNSKVLVSVRSAPEREYAGKIKSILVRLLFALADGIVLQTKAAYEYFPRYIQKKAIILPNSINPVFLKTPFEGKRKQEVVTVGRIDSNKNQILLVKAFAELTKEFPTWKCILYGEGEDYNQIRDYIEEHNLQNQILLAGRQNNIEERIDQSSIFVLPSKIEGMPNALMEAMVMGLAVISTDCPCGGPRDLIKKDYNGILVAVNNQEEMKNALHLLMSNEEYAKKLGKQAEKIIERVHPDVVNKQWEEYIKQLMRKSNVNN